MNELAKIIVAALAAAGLSAWYFSPADDNATPSVATTHPATEGASKVDIAPQKVAVFKPDVKNKLPVPDKVKADKDAHVLAASRCEASDWAHTFTTTIDETTGDSVTYDHRESLPWLSRKTRHALRADYGYKPGGAVTRISYRADLLQIKALHFGVNAAIDSDGEYFVGGGVEWRF